MYRPWLASLLCVTAAQAQSATPKVVALDAFHNDESRLPDHYKFDGVRPGGYSELANLLVGLGAQLKTVRERVTPEVLHGVKVFIVVDPNTPARATDPKYILQDEIAAIEAWVRAGGRLVLLGNNKGNCEFEHFNQLARRFGIEFLEETYPKVEGKGILVARGDTFIFNGAPEVYMVEIAPLKVSAGVKILLADHGTPIMALAQADKGEVFALGDPWLYNEYIDYRNNRAVATNLFRHLLR